MLSIRSKRDVALLASVNTAMVCAVVYLSSRVFFKDGLTSDFLHWALWNAAILTFSLTIFFGWNFRLVNLSSEKLKSLVQQDMLTGTATRDFFFKAIPKDALCNGVTVMVDLDHFKSINDTYGHMAGDRVLARVGLFLREMIRAEDTVCRFGGEEFALFLHDISIGDAHVLVERIRARIEGEPIFESGRVIRITASFGLALPGGTTTLQDELRVADLALYEAKLQGRNRVVIKGGRAADNRTLDVTLVPPAMWSG